MSLSDLSYRFVLFVCHLLKFSRMSKYDITGIGINLREVSDGGGNAKLKVLGIVLHGPAVIAGMKQGDEILAVNGVDVSGKSAFEVSSLLQLNSLLQLQEENH